MEDIIRENRARLDRAEDYDEIFEIVKQTVERTLSIHRAGLSLVLTDMPNLVGAYYPAFSNTIVVNRGLVEDVRRIAKDPREVASFVYSILLHEYLHSLGYLDDNEVRAISKKIAQDNFGEDHPSVRFAAGNWLEIYPELSRRDRTFSKFFRHVEKFDSSSTPYFG
ncbi:MAG: hypothetical protein QXV32_03900 [Conexivisphaerales archaeon]